ncbi:hypothetical protein Rhe02_06160 [Rhizocola hellebori]|uniref:Uncharacterized protein n=1 Tax=Rhizocola hellebori TaxID=1392758 RepID=A0A8J3Q2L9_9ACTN|nr:hypothetical protein [Rhizocola hellebori]GIH02549.1 hypothetical protein Rhe02_06160 [Rhizocola hellebori]
MSNFEGRASLDLLDGSRQHGDARLSGQVDQDGLESWSGTFLPDDPHADYFGSVGENISLELSTGARGRAMLQQEEAGSSVRLVGSGPFPA